MLIASRSLRIMGGHGQNGLLACVLARIGHTATCYDADESLQLTTSAQEAADLVIVTLARLSVYKYFLRPYTREIDSAHHGELRG